VVVGKRNNALQITALDDAAAGFGLEPGLPLANARAICPDLQVFDADDAADACALNAIADWCDKFTPLVALDPPHGLFLDITGCAHLFGGEACMMRTICDALIRQGFIVSAAVASTPVCARTLARYTDGRIVPDGEEAAAVKPLPVFALGAEDTVTRGLRRAGLKRIGDVAARAPHEITARFGAAFTAMVQQALGQGDAPISPRKPLPDYMVEKRFPEPIASDLAITSTLDMLARMLVTAMERHGKGARRLEASFFRTDGAVHVIAVEAGRPVTQTKIVERLFREKLDALADPLDPGFGFDLIRLSASYVETVVQEQRDLDAHAHDNDELSALIDRIAARIGGKRIVVHLPQDTHIPERAEMTGPAQHHLVAATDAVWTPHIDTEPPLRPLRLFDKPEPIEAIAEVPDGPPARFKWRRATHAVARAEGPERIAMEWWRHKGQALTRDYFRVEDDAGLRFWVYRDGLYGSETIGEDGKPIVPHWFMHGLFA
jgi:protein ImuB